MYNICVCIYIYKLYICIKTIFKSIGNKYIVNSSNQDQKCMGKVNRSDPFWWFLYMYHHVPILFNMFDPTRTFAHIQITHPDDIICLSKEDERKH